jgi:hypothetical protein
MNKPVNNFRMAMMMTAIFLTTTAGAATEGGFLGNLFDF